MRLAPVLASVVALGALTSAAKAELVTKFYQTPFPGVSLTYGAVIYEFDEENFLDLTGYNLVNTRTQIEFLPEPGQDFSSLHVEFLVPVIPNDPDASVFLQILGTDLTETSPGLWTYTAETEELNGIIRSGRFSLTMFGLDQDENPIWIPGAFTDTSGFYLTVAIPEPSTTALLLPALGLLARRRR